MERQLLTLLLILLLSGCQTPEQFSFIKEVPESGSIEQISLEEPMQTVEEIIDYENIWDAFIDKSTFSDYQIDALTLNYMNKHLDNPELFTNYLDNSYFFIFYIMQELEKKGLPIEFVLLPFIESSYDPFSISSSGAVGLWQIMPPTANLLGLQKDWWIEERHDPFKSSLAAINYIDYLYQRFDNNLYFVLIAYNAGPTFTQKAINQIGRRNAEKNYKQLRLPSQTQNYVPKFLALLELIKNFEKYGVELPNIPYTPVIDRVSFEQQVEIINFSDFIGEKPELIYLLNAGYTKWATSPKKPSMFYIPIEKKQIVIEKGNEFAVSKNINWISHEVSTGDNLWDLAKKYETKIQIIRDVNQLERDLLSIDQILLITVGNPKNIIIPFDSHVVSEGDTLWSLSNKYNVTPKQIMLMNDIKNPNEIRIGAKLNIGNKNIYRNIESKKRTILYSVKQGDNLYKISQLFNVSVESIKRNNSGITLLKPGQIIKITILAF